VRKLLLATGALLLVAVLLGSRWERFVMGAMAPRAPFDARALPPAPDYADATAWTAHPERDDPADVVPAGLRGIEQTSAPVDVFYVHPTTYLGSAWNGPVDDAELNAQTDELATLIQASAFNGCCAVYGPRYRQAHGQAFVQPGADADSAIDLAYRDVLEAFRFFLGEHSRGRPFILAGHSQGSVLGARLLQREIADSGLTERLVAAYLIGGPINVGPWPGVPACAAPEETGCLVAWNARGPRFGGSVFDFRQDGERLCVNPLTWRRDETPAGAELNQGAIFLHAGDGTVLPGFADARCRDGMLIVSEIGDPPRDLRSRILDFVIGPENYHPIEYQLYYVNLRRNAEERVGAYLRAHAAP
jgi:pimeloyl-ACP methyl ester carboxylesterase